MMEEAPNSKGRHICGVANSKHLCYQEPEAVLSGNCAERALKENSSPVACANR